MELDGRGRGGGMLGDSLSLILGNAIDILLAAPEHQFEYMSSV